MFKMRCGIPNAYNLDITIYFIHVSILIESSSGPSKIQILILEMFKMRCGIPNAYILDITMYFMRVSILIESSSGPSKIQILT